MKLGEDDARHRLAGADHGVLSTLHPVRGVDAVPVVYVVDDTGCVGIPVDTVKAKSTTVLGRQRNLERDPRASLLVEHWDAHDWSALWWVRASLRYWPEPDTALLARLAHRLTDRFPQYRGAPFASMLVLRITELTGWRATER